MLRDSRSGARSLRSVPRAAIGVIGLAAAASLALGACSSDSSSGDGGGDGCLSNRAFFEKEVFSPFMQHKCGTCHADGGEAVLKGAEFQLQTTSYPGFVDANLANITKLSKKIDFSTKESYLLLKPLGKLNHGGGVQLQEDSDDYKNLEALVKRVQDGGDSCADVANATIAKVKSLSAADTLRKASLDIAGRLPTKSETDKVTKGGDSALDDVLETMMKEDVFYDRLSEIWNDLLLTNKYARNGDAVRFMNEDEYPNVAKYYDNDNGDNPDRDLANIAISQEPLNLIRYIVKNDKPFTDIAQANYTVVNPYLAKAYGVNVAFKNPKDANEWHETRVTLGTGVAVPHAGILSTPVFLNRWTTTPTNRNRGRARRVFLYLLATDVLKIADRPVDATQVAKVDNPTMNSDLCVVCHKQIDPIAGGFRGYDDFDYELFDPKSDSAMNWHADMAESGFEGTNMPSSYYTHALQWLGKEVASDSRFQINAVRTTFKGLTGHDPLIYPEDNSSPTFADDLAAWTAQDQFFRDTAFQFVSSKMNLKTVVKAIIKSPYYRGVSGEQTANPALMAGIGTGRILTPEMLSRKVNAIMGFPWTATYDKTHDYLLQDFYITYGGLDSDSVITRLTTPNGLLYAVQQRMANEVACHATAFDFTKAKDQRNLFPMVDVDEVPESAGHAVSGSVNDIKDNIVYLFDRLLGQKVSRSDIEVERAYQLYLDTYHEVSESGNPGIPGDCQGRTDPKTGADLPDGVAITDDANFTIRPWQAVITYLLSDYSFLYE